MNNIVLGINDKTSKPKREKVKKNLVDLLIKKLLIFCKTGRKTSKDLIISRKNLFTFT